MTLTALARLRAVASFAASVRAIPVSCGATKAPVGNLVADVMRAATGADISLINAGTLRAEREVPPGAFSMREVKPNFGILRPHNAITRVGCASPRAVTCCH
jgi:hypothetical protein